MIKFIQTHATGGDYTAPYDVILGKPYTVGEFIAEILSTRPNEWGYVDVICEGSNYLTPSARMEYRHGEALNKLPESILRLQIDIDNVKASGGWSRMDYSLKIAE